MAHETNTRISSRTCERGLRSEAFGLRAGMSIIVQVKGVGKRGGQVATTTAQIDRKLLQLLRSSPEPWNFTLYTYRYHDHHYDLFQLFVFVCVGAPILCFLASCFGLAVNLIGQSTDAAQCQPILVPKVWGSHAAVGLCPQVGPDVPGARPSSGGPREVSNPYPPVHYGTHQKVRKVVQTRSVKFHVCGCKHMSELSSEHESGRIYARPTLRNNQ